VKYFLDALDSQAGISDTRLDEDRDITLNLRQKLSGPFGISRSEHQTLLSK